MSKLSPIVLIFGEDSLRADRALELVLADRQVDPSEINRIWGDESSFAEVFAATTSRSLFSDKTVVLVRRAERLRGGGKDTDQDGGDPSDSEVVEPAAEKPGGRKGVGKPAASSLEIPDLEPGSMLILVVRKADRRLGMWRRLGKVAEMIDAEYLKGRSLTMAAAAEAKGLGLQVSEDVLRETIEHSGPSMGRIRSEFEKMRLYQGAMAKGTEDILAVTSSPPLYHLSDALMTKDRRKTLSLLDDALRQGEAALRILATAQGAVRKVAVFRTLRRTGMSSADAGSQLGIFPFKIADTERASRGWSDSDLELAFSVFAETDRRLKLSAPASPVLTHALARVASGGGT